MRTLFIKLKSTAMWEAVILIFNYAVFFIFPGFVFLDKFKSPTMNNLYENLWCGFLLGTLIIKVIITYYIYIKYDYKNEDDKKVGEKLIDKSYLLVSTPAILYFIKFNDKSKITNIILKLDNIIYFKIARYLFIFSVMLFFVSFIFWRINNIISFIGFEMAFFIWLFVESLSIIKMLKNNDVESLEKYIKMGSLGQGHYEYIKSIIDNWNRSQNFAVNNRKG